MTYLFKNLNENSTFDDFRNTHKKIFGYDYFEETDTDDIPKGKISDFNNEWIRYDYTEKCITMWIDDGNDENETIE